MEKDWSIESAETAYAQARLKEWVIEFLHDTPGSNRGLAKHILDNPGIVFQKPKMWELAQLVPIAGKPEDHRQFTDTQWDARIEKMAAEIEAGWNPPPLIVTNYWGQENSLADGNHRWAALMKAGHDKYWAIYFHNPH